MGCGASSEETVADNKVANVNNNRNTKQNGHLDIGDGDASKHNHSKLENNNIVSKKNSKNKGGAAENNSPGELFAIRKCYG